MADTPNKIKVKTTWGKKEKKSSIKITAKTLGGALKELSKRDEWGKFEGKIGYGYGAADGIVTAVTLTPSYTIEMPTWSGYSKAPKACQKEWDRMWKKLEEHEEEHLNIHLATLKTIEDTLGKATDLPETQLPTDFDQMIADGQANQDKFDKSTGHGSKKGVELNIAKECE